MQPNINSTEANRPEQLTQEEQLSQVPGIREQAVDMARILLSRQQGIQGKYGTHSDILRIFHIQQRLGANDELFYIAKFRSMKPGAHADYQQTIAENGVNARGHVKNDDRVTRLGKFLRATSLDESPQLIQSITAQIRGEEREKYMHLIGAIRPLHEDAWNNLGLRKKNKNRLIPHTGVVPADIITVSDTNRRARFKVWATFLRSAKEKGAQRTRREFAKQNVSGLLRKIWHETLLAYRNFSITVEK